MPARLAVDADRLAELREQARIIRTHVVRMVATRGSTPYLFDKYGLGEGDVAAAAERAVGARA